MLIIFTTELVDSLIYDIYQQQLIPYNVIEFTCTLYKLNLAIPFIHRTSYRRNFWANFEIIFSEKNKLVS